jgi:hypothetical protein
MTLCFVGVGLGALVGAVLGAALGEALAPTPLEGAFVGLDVPLPESCGTFRAALETVALVTVMLPAPRRRQVHTAPSTLASTQISADAVSTKESPATIGTDGVTTTTIAVGETSVRSVVGVAEPQPI